MNLLCNAYPVRYHDIEYFDNYIVVTQNRTRRRVYKGYFFEDTGTHIYISDACANMFQHKNKKRLFMLNTDTKEWCDWRSVEIQKHYPEKRQPLDNNLIGELKK